MEKTTVEPQEISRFGRIWRAVTQTFFKGLIAILPIAATVYVLVWLAGYLDNPGRYVLNAIQRGLGLQEPYDIPGAGLLAGIIVIFVVGLLVNAWLIQQLLGASESLVQRLPLAKTVFSSVRDLMGFFAKSGNRPAGQVVIVTLNGTGARMVGFITRQDVSDLSLGGLETQDLVAVYFPFSYAVGGFTLLLPRSTVLPVDMPVEAAMRFALTAGMKKIEKASQATQDVAEPSDGTTPK